MADFFYACLVSHLVNNYISSVVYRWKSIPTIYLAKDLTVACEWNSENNVSIIELSHSYSYIVSLWYIIFTIVGGLMPGIYVAIYLFLCSWSVVAGLLYTAVITTYPITRDGHAPRWKSR